MVSFRLPAKTQNPRLTVTPAIDAAQFAAPVFPQKPASIPREIFQQGIKIYPVHAPATERPDLPGAGGTAFIKGRPFPAVLQKIAVRATSFSRPAIPFPARNLAGRFSRFP